MESFNLISKVELIGEDGGKTLGLIQDIINDKVYVSIPADDREFKILRIGEHVKGLVYQDNKVVGFNAIITDRINTGFPIYELSNLNNFTKMQRREDIRVPSTIPILYTENKYLLKINPNNFHAYKAMITGNKYLKDGMISDLSAGGLRFACTQNLYLGTNLLLVFNIKDELVFTKGQIVYKELSSSPQKTIYTYGIKFIDISERIREKIINYIFVLMRKNKVK